MNDIPQELQDDVIKNAFSKAEFATMPKNQQENYHKNLKTYRDLVNSFDFAHKEGEREGIKKIVKNLLKANMSLELIAQTTGLSIEEIKKI
ncbi:MAG: hypothetical protein U9O24_05890 [Campylobacterota bacterium]|nr:hypothetical protein [Campylobacterota bacterium]